MTDDEFEDFVKKYPDTYTAAAHRFHVARKVFVDTLAREIRIDNLLNWMSNRFFNGKNTH